MEIGRISVIAMDLDGTLLGADQKVSDENCRVLRECAARGIRIVLASGRSFESVRTFAKAIGIEDCGIISCNGARVDETVHGPVILEDCFSKEQALMLFEELRRCSIYFECYTPGRIYMTNGFVERFHSHEARVLEMDGYRLEYIDGTERMRREALDHAYKFVLYSPDPNVLARAAERMKQFDVAVTSSWGDNVELMKTDAGKGKAVLAYAARYGIEKDEIMGFGDQLNDLSMISSVGVGVAMENASPELKAVADETCGHVADDGIYHYCLQHGLI
jgi:Cof subfamily protein (haloacid dehalogenase superfamily)